jgi:hypothetical protein
LLPSSVFGGSSLLSVMSINTIVINIILDGQNYPEWAFCVETALRGYHLYFHLIDDPPTVVADPSNANAIQT